MIEQLIDNILSAIENNDAEKIQAARNELMIFLKTNHSRKTLEPLITKCKKETRLIPAEAKKELWGFLFSSLYSHYDNNQHPEEKLEYEQGFLILASEWNTTSASGIYFNQFTLMSHYTSYLNNLIQVYINAGIQQQEELTSAFNSTPLSNVTVRIVKSYLFINVTTPIGLLADNKDASEEVRKKSDKEAAAMLTLRGPFYSQPPSPSNPIVTKALQQALRI